jgi:hypothetical protein
MRRRAYQHLTGLLHNFTTTQQLSRGETMDASLCPFVMVFSFSSSGSSITAPSSFISTAPPSPFASQTLAYQPSPFAPPPSSSVPVRPAPSLPVSQFTSPHDSIPCRRCPCPNRQRELTRRLWRPASPYHHQHRSCLVPDVPNSAL